MKSVNYSVGNFRLFFILLIVSLILPVQINAKNIDLSTIPSRDSVQLTIYNAEDLTLVRETRQISIKKGRNHLQFSWANTQIDPTSVQIEFLSNPDKLQLINTTYPHEKPQMMYWNIQSSIETLSTVEISYFTSGISWKADYTAIVEPSSKQMKLDNFVTVTNNSGEDYEQAKVRLVIGKINLVEKVSDLVNQSYQKRDELEYRKKAKLEKARQFMRKTPGRYEMLAAPMAAPGAVMEDAMIEEKEVEKDSLSEYTIFSIEGTETIPNQWSKRLRSGTANEIGLETVYRYRPREYGEKLVRVYIFNNSKESSLGVSPLPEGKIQIYQKNTQGSLTYIAGLNLNYVSIGEKVELNTAANPEIHFELVNLKNWRDNIWMHYKKANVYRRIGDGHIQIDHNSRVAGWDEHSLYVQHLRNPTDQAIDIEIRRVIYGDAQFKSSLEVKKHDFQTVQLETRVDAGEKIELLYETTIKKGKNAEQNQLQLETKKLSYPVY